MTSARFSFGATIATAGAGAHRMLVAGGADAPGRRFDLCELYDAAADRWLLQEARLPQAMCCRAAPIVGASAVLALQIDSERNTRCALLDVRSSSSSWQSGASALIGRGHHAVAAVGEHAVVMLGGWDTAKQATDTAQLYDVRADRWSERPEWRLPAPSCGHCAAVIE